MTKATNEAHCFDHVGTMIPNEISAGSVVAPLSTEPQQHHTNFKEKQKFRIVESKLIAIHIQFIYCMYKMFRWKVFRSWNPRQFNVNKTTAS